MAALYYFLRKVWAIEYTQPKAVYAIVLYFKNIRWAKILFWLEIVTELVSKAYY